MKSILVICEGNICRSPMAQGLLAAARPSLSVQSAGLGALVGMPADPLAVGLVKQRGIDISAHRAVQVSRQACLDADIVFVMEAEQRTRLESLYLQVRGRVFRLGEYIHRDIPDPYHKGETAFRDALALIDRSLATWLTRMDKL